MKAARVDLIVTSNACDERTITLPGYTSAAGVTATTEFRASHAKAAKLYLALTNGSGFTVTSDGANLLIDWYISETQLDALRDALAADDKAAAAWSLKVDPGNGRTRHYFYGVYSPQPVATE